MFTDDEQSDEEPQQQQHHEPLRKEDDEEEEEEQHGPRSPIDICTESSEPESDTEKEAEGVLSCPLSIFRRTGVLKT